MNLLREVGGICGQTAERDILEAFTEIELFFLEIASPNVILPLRSNDYEVSGGTTALILKLAREGPTMIIGTTEFAYKAND